MRSKAFRTLALVAALPLCTAPAGGQAIRKFCENPQYLAYSGDQAFKKIAKYYVLKLPEARSSEPNGVARGLSARYQYGQLSMAGPAALECSAYGAADDDFYAFKQFACNAPGSSDSYDPTIGSGLEFDEHDNASERNCLTPETFDCFIVRDKGGNRYFTSATSLIEPLIRAMNDFHHEIISDGTTDGTIRTYTKEFAFSRGGYSYFLIGYEEQGGLKCNFERAPEPQF